MSKNNRSPISSLIAGILHILILIVVINVIVKVFAARDEGRDVNIAKEVIVETYELYEDMSEGWSEAASDSIREKKDTNK